MTTIQTIKEAEERFEEKFRPIDFCHVGDDKMTYVEYTRDGIKSHITQTLLAVFESELEEIKKMKWGSPYINGDFTHNNEDAYHYNLAIKDISSHLTEVINYLKQK